MRAGLPFTEHFVLLSPFFFKDIFLSSVNTNNVDMEWQFDQTTIATVTVFLVITAKLKVMCIAASLNLFAPHHSARQKKDYRKLQPKYAFV